MACTIASIARDEVWTQPTLLFVNKSNPDKAFQENKSIGLTSSQRNMLLKGMESVTSNEGTGRLVNIKNLLIAGKTGTADFRAWKGSKSCLVCRLCSINNPRIAIAVMVEGTKEAQDYHGGSTAGLIKDIFLKHQENILILKL